MSTRKLQQCNRYHRQISITAGTRVVSDGLACFHGISAARCAHDKVVAGGGLTNVLRPKFRWVNTVLGNVKSTLRGTYHAIRPKYAQRYLSEFEYRFDRRFDLPDIIPRLAYLAFRTPPMPEQLLELNLTLVVIGKINLGVNRYENRIHRTGQCRRKTRKQSASKWLSTDSAGS